MSVSDWRPLPFLVHPGLGVISTGDLPLPLVESQLPDVWNQAEDQRPELFDQWMAHVLHLTVHQGYRWIVIRDQAPPSVRLGGLVSDAEVEQILRINGTFSLTSSDGRRGLTVFDAWSGCTVSADVAEVLVAAGFSRPAL